MKKRTLTSLLLTVTMVCSLPGLCFAFAKTVKADDKPASVNIAYQYGLAYAPLMIAQDQELIEKAYKDATGKEVEVTWTQMKSGADINVAITSGSIQVGFMGVAPAITGIMNNVGYKIFTNLSGQEHGLMTSDSQITSLSDLIGSDKQIALVNIGSIQHIILAKALQNAGEDPHALDSNLVAMSHPDGMTALETGALSIQLTTNPYLYREREENFYEIEGVSEAWSKDKSFIVGVASTSLYDSDPDLYNAVCEAFSNAITYINDNMEEASALTCELNGNSQEDELKYMKEGHYSANTSGIFELATFMADAGFIEEAPQSFTDLAFDNVEGD